MAFTNLRHVFIYLVSICLGFSLHNVSAYASLLWQSPGLTVSIDPAIKNVGLDHTFTVDVTIDDAADLGAFQFDINYDPSVITVTDVTLGPFLGSTGRTAQPIGSHIDNTAGVATFGAFSFGNNAGPDGTGLLATVTLKAVGSGTSALNLQNVLVTDTIANTQSASMQNGTVAVAAPTSTRSATMTPSSTMSPTSTKPTPTKTLDATETVEPVNTFTPTNTATVTAAGGTTTATPPSPVATEAATATAAGDTTITPTSPPVAIETATVTASSEKSASPNKPPIATETDTPVVTAPPTRKGSSISTPHDVQQPQTTATSVPASTPGAVLSRIPTFTPRSLAGPVTALESKELPPASSTASPPPAAAWPLGWLTVGGLLLVIAGYIILFALLRRHKA